MAKQRRGHAKHSYGTAMIGYALLGKGKAKQSIALWCSGTGWCCNATQCKGKAKL